MLEQMVVEKGWKRVLEEKRCREMMEKKIGVERRRKRRVAAMGGKELQGAEHRKEILATNFCINAREKF